jgi:hypothetical protein
MGGLPLQLTRNALRAGVCACRACNMTATSPGPGTCLKRACQQTPTPCAVHGPWW